MSGTIQALDLPFDEAIAFLRQKTNIPTQRWTDVWRDGHSRGFMVAGAASQALVGDFREAVTRAIEDGESIGEFRKRFETIADQHGWRYNGTPGWRAQIIYETNLATAYSAGRYAQMTEPETLATFPFWQYVHSGSSHPRLNHLAWNGLVLRADDGWWATHYPPNGWRCGCSVRPVMAEELRGMGKRGPDRAPPLAPRAVNVPGRGTVQVPAGIDPGFDYNPGLAWKRGEVKPPGEPGTPAPAPPRPRPDAPFAPPARAGRSDLAQALTDAYAPWAETLTPQEASSLTAYKNLGGRPMNQALRGELANEPVRWAGEMLDGALRRAVLPQDVRVFRGVHGAELEQLRRLRAGDTWRSGGLISTSIDRAVADRMAQGGTTAEIHLRGGNRGGAYVAPFPKHHLQQYEMLLSRRSAFRVVRGHADGLILEHLGVPDDE